MANESTSPVDFICPFVDGNYRCPEIMSPARSTPGNRERKLFALLERPEGTTKIACPHCSLFIQLWNEQVGVIGHVRYLLKWLKDEKLRRSLPQE